MTNPYEVAAKLTKAQRALLCGLLVRPLRPASYGQVRGALRRKGLWAEVGFTPLGRKVRAILQEQSYD